MEAVFIVAGILAILTYYLFRTDRLKQPYPIVNSEKDQNILFFVISNLGLWLLLPAVFFLLKKNLAFQAGFNIIIGLAIGLFIGLRSLLFWMSESDSARSRPEEAIGSVGIGCFGLFFHITIGLILAILL